MVLTKEYRICMPLTVDEYQIGQLYMIARHSHEQSSADDGVEVVENRECEDPEHGKGQFTEKRIHLSSRLPYWLQAFIPRVFYVTEKAWNYYPLTLTEYTCSFLPKLCISIKTKYENNNGSSENCLNLSREILSERIVENVDIAYDEVSPKHYKEEEDLRFYQSSKTGRGPLMEGWRDSTVPIMCSYKMVQVSFEVWGLQTKVEDFIHKSIQEILLLGHRQAFAWIDEWHGMTLESVRQYEGAMQQETNMKMASAAAQHQSVASDASDTEPKEDYPPVATVTTLTPTSPKSPSKASWFSWSS